MACYTAGTARPSAWSRATRVAEDHRAIGQRQVALGTADRDPNRGGAVVAVPGSSAGPGCFADRRRTMAVARVSEISATSPQSFEDAIRQGLERATKTLRGVTSAWIKDQRVKLDNGRIAEYQVNMEVTFVLEG